MMTFKEMTPAEIEAGLVAYVAEKMKDVLALPEPEVGLSFDENLIRRGAGTIRKELAATNRLTREGVRRFYFLLNMTGVLFVVVENRFGGNEGAMEGGTWGTPYRAVALDLANRGEYWGTETTSFGSDIEMIQMLTGASFRSVFRFRLIGFLNRPTRKEIDSSKYVPDFDFGSDELVPALASLLDPLRSDDELTTKFQLIVEPGRFSTSD